MKLTTEQQKQAAESITDYTFENGLEFTWMLADKVYSGMRSDLQESVMRTFEEFPEITSDDVAAFARKVWDNLEHCVVWGEPYGDFPAVLDDLDEGYSEAAEETITEEVRDVLNFWLEEYGEGEEEA